VLVSDFNYHLPQELIAQNPLPDRAASRLLRLCHGSRDLSDGRFTDFPGFLRRDDLLVFNNTRVFPARLYGTRSGARSQPVSPSNPASRDFLTGRVEILLTRQLSAEPNEWECLVRPGRKVGVGERLFFSSAAQESGGVEGTESNGPQRGAGVEDGLQAEVLTRGKFGERRIRFAPVADFFGLVERLGHIPLPPYIARDDLPEDRLRYQTVYARERGSVAAPTAGLHFTAEILSALKQRGIETTEITLHVGLGTFQPIRNEHVEENKLHPEAYVISSAAAEAVNRARDSNRRIVAVGTTTTRTLEYAAGLCSTGRIEAGQGEANLFIYPGYRFRVVGALLTNFHLPHSTLLMLVCAFGGRERALAAYRHAVEQEYRFYSYGDCMFVE
jgi:S-adenosylmethionine:tRNA ribosyltransferase-isomerase